MPLSLESSSILSRILPFLRDRRYAAGERIPSERELADRFQVSRGILREALSTLEAMRVIERRPQSGIYLRDLKSESSLDMLVLEADLGMPVSPAEVQDLNEFRSMLEIQAVRLACQRRTDEDLMHMEQILHTSEERLAAGQSLAEQDAQFHLAMCAASGNQLILRAAHSFWLASRARRQKYFQNTSNNKRSLRQHRSLWEAIAQKDEAQALHMLGKHLGQVHRYWLTQLQGETS
jgi:GntR family transcriptional repressor for pyruvate dehydrogenase complex